MIATLVNHAWWAMTQRSARRMQAALLNPSLAQSELLQSILRSNQGTVFGREHGFDRIQSAQDYAQRVPIRRYDDLKPWIDRVATGEPNVLTAEPVGRLLPSSGSTAARKLIPFTRTLSRQFNAAVGPWIDSNFRECVDLARGRGYWSITPAVPHEHSGPVPVGFEDDSAYLGGVLGRLVRGAMAVPAEVTRIHSLEAFRYATLLALLRCADLRFISVWHPSFFELLLNDMPLHWDRLLSDVESGRCSLDAQALPVPEIAKARPARTRAQELRRAGPSNARAIWPALRLVSCWADAGAAGPARSLHLLLGGVPLQAKGLLATEGVVSIPMGQQHPLAIRSHFLEFLCDGGTVHLAHELCDNQTYEVLLTTGGGLYRYRLGDLIRVDGRLGQTPSVRFVGRADGVCDLVGEKLSEAFVGGVLDRWMADVGAEARFAMLAPSGEGQQRCYELYLECASPLSPEAAHALDTLLCENPHYELARRLGQLGAVQLCPTKKSAFDRYAASMVARGMRLGDIKPLRLSTISGWSQILCTR